VVGLALLALAAWSWPPSASERAGWLGDLAALERFTGESYANLADRLRARGIQPRELDRATREALLRATSLGEARAALRSFVAAFGDGHFEANPRPGVWKALLSHGEDGEAIPASSPAAEACERLGFTIRDGGRVAWSSLPGWRALGGGTAERPFPAGTAPGPGGGLIGVLRIPLFAGWAFPASCAARWEAWRGAGGGRCDSGCQEELRDEVDRSLVERLAAQVAELRAAGARLVVVDVTRNGGGSGLSGPFARQLTAIPVQAPAMGFVRHPHWESQLAEAVDRLEAELARDDLAEGQRRLVERAREGAAQAKVEAGRRCDLSGIWSQEESRLPCDPVARLDGYPRYARPGELDGLLTKDLLFGASRYPYREGAWSGPLVVLVDRSTASDAEQFVAMLRDAGAARVAGQRTMGVGCGYTNGGLRLELSHTALVVRVPDCVRYRADGTSEAEGVTPDVPVPWADGDDGPTRARKVLAALAP
jgi:Peptidase family S41